MGFSILLGFQDFSRKLGLPRTAWDLLGPQDFLGLRRSTAPPAPPLWPHMGPRTSQDLICLPRTSQDFLGRSPSRPGDWILLRFYYDVIKMLLRCSYYFIRNCLDQDYLRIFILFSQDFITIYQDFIKIVLSLYQDFIWILTGCFQDFIRIVCGIY